MYIIPKTGSGKSAIPFTVGLLLMVVVITLVPHISLRSDQVSQSFNSNNYIKAYHADKLRGKDGKKLRNCLNAITVREADYVTVFLYMSPQSLQMDSLWYGVIRRMASMNFIWLLCIDDAHTVYHNGLFRTEFKSTVNAICQIHRLLSVKCSIVAMSATFRKVDQDVITQLLGWPPSLVMWLELSCLRICYDAVCCGNPTTSITLPFFFLSTLRRSISFDAESAQ